MVFHFKGVFAFTKRSHYTPLIYSLYIFSRICSINEGHIMTQKTPQEVADKWATRLGQSTAAITAGVDRVTINPAEKALAAKDKMVTNWNNAVNEGKWESGLQRVTLSSWKNDMKTKGIARIASGANAAKPKMQAFMTDFLPFVTTVQTEIDDMPDLTIEDSIARATHWIRRTGDFKR